MTNTDIPEDRGAAVVVKRGDVGGGQGTVVDADVVDGTVEVLRIISSSYCILHTIGIVGRTIIQT